MSAAASCLHTPRSSSTSPRTAPSHFMRDWTTRSRRTSQVGRKSTRRDRRRPCGLDVLARCICCRQALAMARTGSPCARRTSSKIGTGSYDCGRRLGRSGRHGISAGYVTQDTAGAARAGAVEGSRAQLVGAEQQPAASQDETHLDITAEEAAADARTSASLLFSAAAVGDMDVVADAAAAGLPHGAAAHPPATAHRGLQTHTHRTHGHAYSRTAVRIPNSIRESAQVSA